MLKIKKNDGRTEKLQKQMVIKRAVNLEVDAILFKRFKAKVAANGETITNVLTAAIEKYLKD